MWTWPVAIVTGVYASVAKTAILFNIIGLDSHQQINRSRRNCLYPGRYNKQCLTKWCRNWQYRCWRRLIPFAEPSLCFLNILSELIIDIATLTRFGSYDIRKPGYSLNDKCDRKYINLLEECVKRYMKELQNCHSGMIWRVAQIWCSWS